VVDDFGRYPAHPSLLRAAAYPLRLDKVTNEDISEYLGFCVEAELVQVYTAEGKSFLQVLNFAQQMRAKSSKYPAPDPHTQGEGGSRDEHMRSGCVAPAMQVIRGGSADAKRMRSEAETETETETPPDGGFPLDAFFEETYARHPKKRDRVLAEQALCKIPGIETAKVQDEFRASHERWCQSEGWLWKDGASAPTLAVFISDQGWKYDPRPPEIRKPAKVSSEGRDPYTEWVPPPWKDADAA
jgi:hypothetical protein